MSVVDWLVSGVLISEKKRILYVWAADCENSRAVVDVHQCAIARNESTSTTNPFQLWRQHADECWTNQVWQDLAHL